MIAGCCGIGNHDAISEYIVALQIACIDGGCPGESHVVTNHLRLKSSCCVSYLDSGVLSSCGLRFTDRIDRSEVIAVCAIGEVIILIGLSCGLCQQAAIAIDAVGLESTRIVRSSPGEADIVAGLVQDEVLSRVCKLHLDRGDIAGHRNHARIDRCDPIAVSAIGTVIIYVAEGERIGDISKLLIVTIQHIANLALGRC